MVKIVPDCYLSLMPTAKMIDRWGLYRDYKLFNVDFRMDHRYYLAHGIFPMGLLDTGEDTAIWTRPTGSTTPSRT